MTATIISNVPPFGLLTNQTIAEIYKVNESVNRLQSAVATAAVNYTGTPGTEYEGNGTNFGVAPGTGVPPGAKGTDYAFAINTISAAWQTFWNACEGSIQSLDNGVTS